MSVSARRGKRPNKQSCTHGWLRIVNVNNDMKRSLCKLGAHYLKEGQSQQPSPGLRIRRLKDQIL